MTFTKKSKLRGNFPQINKLRQELTTVVNQGGDDSERIRRQCNLEKTSVIPVKKNFDTSDRLCPEFGLKWESEFTLLGFQINSRLNNFDVNYKKCFECVLAISRKWARYQLSLKGRITIAKTFMLPQFTYIASVLTRRIPPMIKLIKL